MTLNKGDCVIFSSRTIPGNEKAVGSIINGLIAQGIEVITDRTHLVHVSGHPRRDELRDMIGWVRPQLLIPVHGEALHLFEHAKLARAAGVPKVLTCRNGDLVKLGPGEPGIIDELPTGRLYKDGNILEDSKSRAVVERRRMAFAGCAFVALAMDEKGELADDPEIDLIGIPEKNAAGEVIDEIVFDAVVSTVEGSAAGAAARSGCACGIGAPRRSRFRERALGQETVVLRSRALGLSDFPDEIRKWAGFAKAASPSYNKAGEAPCSAGSITWQLRSRTPKGCQNLWCARRRGFRGSAAARTWRHHRVRHLVQHQDRIHSAVG